MHLDHVTIRARDMESTKAFFLKVFDLEERPRPRVIQHIPGHWLFHKNQPLVHIISTYDNRMNAYGSIDHVGIHLEGYHDFRKKLESLRIPYSPMDIEELGERRIFFRTPELVLLEAIFHEEIVN